MRVPAFELFALNQHIPHFPLGTASVRREVIIGEDGFL